MSIETMIGNWGEPVRAAGDEAVKIALDESSADEPLWLCRFGEPDAWACCVGIEPKVALSMPAGHTSGLYLPIGRVGWCVVGDIHDAESKTSVERIVEGPYQRKVEAFCKLATWSALAAKAGKKQLLVSFSVRLRHTPETFWQMVRRMDAERTAAKRG
jgi:hypothetical protein